MNNLSNQTIYEQQKAYLRQLKSNVQNERFKEYTGDHSWRINYVFEHPGEKNQWGKCEHIKNNGKPCGHRIKWEYNLVNRENELIKVGSTCVQKLLGVKEKSTSEFSRMNEEMLEHEKNLERKLVDLDKFTKGVSQQGEKLSEDEKSKIIRTAMKLEIIPHTLKLIIDEGLELTEKQYTVLKQKNEHYISQLREKEDLRKRAEEEQLRKEKLRAEKLQKLKEEEREERKRIRKLKIQQRKKSLQKGEDGHFNEKEERAIEKRVIHFVESLSSGKLFMPGTVLKAKFQIEKVPSGQKNILKKIILRTLENLALENKVRNIDGIQSFDLGHYRKL